MKRAMRTKLMIIILSFILVVPQLLDARNSPEVEANNKNSNFRWTNFRPTGIGIFSGIRHKRVDDYDFNNSNNFQNLYLGLIADVTPKKFITPFRLYSSVYYWQEEDKLHPRIENQKPVNEIFILKKKYNHALDANLKIAYHLILPSVDNKNIFSGVGFGSTITQESIQYEKKLKSRAEEDGDVEYYPYTPAKIHSYLGFTAFVGGNWNFYKNWTLILEYELIRGNRPPVNNFNWSILYYFN